MKKTIKSLVRVKPIKRKGVEAVWWNKKCESRVRSKQVKIFPNQFKQDTMKGPKIKMEMSGRLRGSSKTKNAQWIGEQRLNMQSYTTRIQYTEKKVNTRWGNIGIKVWKSE